MKFANAAVAATLAISLLVAGMSATAAECPDEEGAQLGSDSVATLEPEESAEAIPEPVAETLDYPEETSEQILEEMLGDELGAGEVEYVDAAALEADAGTANAFGTELLSVLNAERAKYSLQPLKLTVAAQAYTQTYTQTWTSRYSTCGKSSLAGCHMDTLLGGGSTTYRAQELKKQGWRNGGDLLARGFSSEEAVARAWLNSDAHRKWIMDGYGAMTAVGLGKVSTTTTSGHITTTTNTWTLWIVGPP